MKRLQQQPLPVSSCEAAQRILAESTANARMFSNNGFPKGKVNCTAQTTQKDPGDHSYWGSLMEVIKPLKLAQPPTSLNTQQDSHRCVMYEERHAESEVG